MAVLDVIGIDPDAQGKGIGKALLAEIERRMKARGIGTLRTQVDWSNPRDDPFLLLHAGFLLAPVQILERDTSPSARRSPGTSVRAGRQMRDRPCVSAGTITKHLSRDRVLVRSSKEEDLRGRVRIDRMLTGRDRSAYYAAKFREMLTESGIRVSLGAEEDGFVAGFVMARVDFGNSAKSTKRRCSTPSASTPAFGGSGIGNALLSQLFCSISPPSRSKPC